MQAMPLRRPAPAARLVLGAVLLCELQPAAAFIAGALGRFARAPARALHSRAPVRHACASIRMSGSADSLSSLSGDDAPSESDEDFVESPPSAAVRVLTYNVLSSSLCEADYHVKCQAEDLDERTRLGRVMDLLAPEIDTGAILCLQEVSTKWAGALHAHLSGKDYHMIHMGYGGRFDGYMGCAIAFPTAKYSLAACKIERVADLKKWPRLARPGKRQRMLNFLTSVWRNWKGIRPPKDPYQDTKNRANQIIMLRLSDKASGASFCLATYHMPCQFRLPEVMVSHAALSLRYLQRYARSDPLIFCGDFNFKPGDSPYRLVTEGTLAKDDEHYPTLPTEDSWRPKIEYPMRSAYKVVNGREPEYTNWAFTRGGTEDFIDCLDYIFLSEGVEVSGVRALPQRETSPGPYPSATEPSDHVLLTADVIVSHKGNVAGAAVTGFGGRNRRKPLRSEAECADEFRGTIADFLADENKAKMDFPTSLNSFERLTIHRLAQEAGVLSGSSGVGRDRKISIWKE